jgi:formate C-acetyltransferase
MDEAQALELTECLWLKFNQIVYLRNRNSAKYFAGFPIGFNIAVGGVDADGNDTYNELSMLFLQAQEELGLPQPNLSVRLNKNSSHELMQKAIQVVSKGSGMPQFFNDEAIVPTIQKDLGFSEADGVWTLEKTEYTLTVMQKEEDTEAGILRTFTVSATGDGKDLFSLPSTRYLPKEVSP